MKAVSKDRGGLDAVMEALAARNSRIGKSPRAVRSLGPSGTLACDETDAFLAIDESAMSAGFVISSVRRDIAGDIVIPAGCLDTLDSYASTAGVFFAHETCCAPVALCRDKAGALDLQVGPDRITARAWFHGKTRESDEVFGLVAAGILKGASIGFMPLEAQRIEGKFDGSSDKVDFDFGGFLFTRWRLTEWSVVPVPCNPDAVRRALDKGVRTASVAKMLAPFAAMPRGKSFAALSDAPGGLKEGPHGQAAAQLPSYEDPKEQGGMKPQCLLFSRSSFPEDSMVLDWLGAQGLEHKGGLSPVDAPGSEGGGEWVAADLFPAEQCQEGSARLETLEDGVRAVYCRPCSDETPSEPPSKSMTDETVAKGTDAPVAVAIEAVQAAIEAKSGLGVAEGPGSLEPSPAKAFPGEAALKGLMAMAEAMEGACKEHSSTVEHPKALRAIKRVHKLAGRVREHCGKAGHAAYPGAFPEPPPPAAGKPGAKALLASMLASAERTNEILKGILDKPAAQVLVPVAAPVAALPVPFPAVPAAPSQHEIAQKALADKEAYLEKKWDEVRQLAYELLGKEI